MLRLLSLGFAFWLLAAAVSAQATHYYVDAATGDDTFPGSRSQPFRSVTKAVGVGTTDAVIHVGPGTYSAAATGEVFTIGLGLGGAVARNVRILGAGASQTVLDFAGAGASAAYYFQVWRGASDVEIAHLTMQAGATSPWYAAAVGFDCDGLHLHHCVIKDCLSGIIGWGGARNVRIHDNIFDGCQVAVRFRQTSANGALDNRFFHNLVVGNTGFHAVSLSGGDPAQVLVNNIISGSSGIGFDLGTPMPGVVFENNCAFGNGTDFNATIAIPSSNITADPLFMDPANGDYRLQIGSPCLEAGYPQAQPRAVNDFYGNARVSDVDNDSVAVADIGIFEAPGLSLSVANWGQGQTTTFSLAPQQPGVALAVLFLSVRPTAVVVQPFGLIGVDLSPGASFLMSTVSLPGTVQRSIPVDPALDDFEVWFQAFALGGSAAWKPSGRLDLIL